MDHADLPALLTDEENKAQGKRGDLPRLHKEIMLEQDRMSSFSNSLCVHAQPLKNPFLSVHAVLLKIHVLQYHTVHLDSLILGKYINFNPL